MTEASRRCPVCGTVLCDWLHRQEFAAPEEHPLAGGYDVVACRTCGMAYADSAVDQVAYDAFYARFSKYPGDRDNYRGRRAVESGPPWELARLRETASLFARHLPATTGPVVDIGCANGGLLVFMRELGFSDLTGLDPSAEAAANASANPGVRGLAGSLHRVPPGLGRFDAAVLAHVLEHVWDVDGAMVSLRSLLAPAGLVYVEVPDAARYAEHLVAPFHDFSTEHINHFSLVTLSALMARWGFEPVEVGDRVVGGGPGVAQPVVWGVWRLAAGTSVPARPPAIADGDLADRIRSYIDRSHALLAGFEEFLADALRPGEDVIVWGVGELTMKLLQLPSLAGRQIVLVDSSPVKQGQWINGVPVVGPEAVPHDGSPIVIGSIHHQESIARAVRDAALPNPLVTLGRVLAGSRPLEEPLVAPAGG